MKQQISILLVSLLVFASFPAAIFADETNDTGKYSTKDEVIYGKLDGDGRPTNMYVVNSFNVTKPGHFVDHGNYITVSNLTDLSTIKQSSQREVLFEADEDFYYQGELKNKTLPWNISIRYLLDGQETKPAELAGQSGKLEIQITTTANEAFDPVFFDYYLLQISMKLDTLIFDNILAPKGTEAKEGKDSLISFNVMPGEKEEIIVSANVRDLEMDPIDIVAIPANLAIEGPDTDDLTGDIDKLVDAIDEVHSGVGSLKSATSQLSSGASDLSDGSNSFLNGLTELDQSSAELVNGSKEILGVFQQIDSSLDDIPELPDLDDLKTLPNELRTISKELTAFASNLDGLTEAINAIPDSAISEEQFNAVYEALEDADAETVKVVEQLEATYYAAHVVKDLTAEISELSSMMTDIADSFIVAADELETSLENTDGLDDLENFTSGLSQIASEYEVFHNGLVQYTDGVGKLNTSYKDLNSGTKELASGAAELSGGVNDLHDGTKELQKETSDLPDQLKSEIDHFMDEFDYSDFEPTSFVSDKNEKVGVTQFVLQTESIELDEEEEFVEEEEEEINLWNRFLNLFK